MANINYIEIFKGDDTDAIGYQTITAHISTTLDLTGCKALFTFLDFSQTFNEIPEDGILTITIPSAQTAKFPLGIQFAKMQIFDSSNKVRTFANRIPVFVTNKTFEGCEHEFEITFNPLPQVLAGGMFDLNGSDMDFRNKVKEIWKYLGGQTQYEDKGDYANIKLKYEQPTSPEEGDAYVDGDLVWRIYKNGAWEIFSGGQVETYAPSTDLEQGFAADAKLTAEFVNSSINNLAAYYLTADAAGNAFSTKAALTSATVFYNGGIARTPTKNDYLIVLEDESKTTSLGVNPTTRYVYDGSAWAFQYVVNNTSLTQEQVDAINSGITALLVSWLSAFKGTDTATTLQDLVKAESGKGIVDIGTQTSDFTTAARADVATGLNDGSGNTVGYSYGSGGWTDQKGNTIVFSDRLPYAKSSTVGTRQVLTITATTAQSVTLPAIPNTDEVLNCDIAVNGTAATADFGLTLVGGTGVSVYYPNGEAITCKSGCVTMVSCVGINGLGWLVVGCNNLKTAS